MSPDPAWMSCEQTPSTGSSSSDSGNSSGSEGKKQVFHFTDFSEVQKDVPVFHFTETKPCTEFALPMTTSS